MTRLPLVSIIIPCYNAAPRLAACLQSCCQQTYPHLEILVIDNNSTDGSGAIVQRIAQTTPHPLTLLHCQPQGQNHARNVGFAQAQGDYIQWLDADDALHPDKIACQVAALEQHSDFDIACGDWEWWFYDQKQVQYRLSFSAHLLPDTRLQFLLHHWHPPHAYLLRRTAADALSAVQGWHPDTWIGADRHYFTLAALLGLRFLTVGGAIVQYNYWSATQMSRSAPYGVRLENLKQMYRRFQQVALTHAATALSGQHWFLLRQNWDVWQLSPAVVSEQGEHGFWMQSRDRPVGMTLTGAEAQIVLALHQLGGAYTLEDHAHRILRWLWQQVVQQPEGEAATVSNALAKRVGLLPEAPRSLLTEPSTPGVDRAIAARLSAIASTPLYAPLFPEQRLAILQLLDKLRVAGLLTQVIPKSVKAVASNP